MRASTSDYARPNKSTDRVVSSYDGYTSYLLVIDEASRMAWVFLTKSKDPPIDIVRAFLTLHGHSDGGCVRTDQGGELASSGAFRDLLMREFSYSLEPTGADSPSQNGAVEIYNDKLGIRTRALLYGAGLPAKYSSAALVHSVYLHNRLVHNTTLSTPFGLYYGVKPDLEFLRTFGSRVCVASARCCEGRMRNHALLPLQGSGAVCAPLRERDLEHNRDRAGTSGRVPYPRRIPDGAESQTLQRFVWELDITLDEGRA